MRLTKHYPRCHGKPHCVCDIIAQRNKYRRAILKALKCRLEHGSVPFPDYAASMTAALTKAMKD